MNRKKLEKLIDDFSLENLEGFLFDANFTQDHQDISFYNSDGFFTDIKKIGSIVSNDSKKIIVSAIKVENDLSDRASRKKQYDLAKKILAGDRNHDAGIFVFFDSSGRFRFSLIHPIYSGTTRRFNNFKRYTYFVSGKEFTNKTFLKQIGDGDFSTLEHIKEAFSLSAVTDIFYNDFFKEYDKVVEAVKIANKIKDDENSRDFVLLFAIRTVFIGFIQKRGWIGDDEKFIQNFFKEYETNVGIKNQFYGRWLSPLFFEALNTPPGTKVSYRNNEFSDKTEQALQLAPYLNGGLFRQKRGYDDRGWYIPDEEVKGFFEFLFSHSFTIEENSTEDEDLQLNPEFLGIIFERLVNKADGAVYTPRTEVDFMCRLSLVKWLQKNLSLSTKTKDLHELFFKESEIKEDQKTGTFSEEEATEILKLLENIAICDPAVGSGAFLVGMMQVLDETEEVLNEIIKNKTANVFERKKRIMARSLYGVEVKEWAVWISQLRLWLSLFIDAPEDLRTQQDPILPSLDFKVRQGDSLVQMLGDKLVPVEGGLHFGAEARKRLNNLKEFKEEYFYNKTESDNTSYKEREAITFSAIYDEIIKDKEKELKNLKKDPSILQNKLFDVGEIRDEKEISLFSEKIKNLEEELGIYKEERRNIRESHPLIWGIEFAEVFGEKGGFDIIIGNPPYVRQEDISDPTGKIKDKKEYKGHLQEMVKLDFPNDFPPKTKINAQSDLYTYFYIRGLRLLNQQGIHTFICSNSWLDVGYGAWLQDFLLKHCPVELIIDNHAKRSFGAADVNTIISIINAPQKKIDDNCLVKFVAFKKPFEESVYTENMFAIENTKKVESNDVFRAYPITIKDLKETGMEYEENTLTEKGKYIGDKWGGKYLRAPDIFFTILEKGKDKLVRLGDIAEVRFGIKTGVNEFFYLDNNQIKQLDIEAEFLRPVIKSPRECNGILVNPNDLKYKIFICNKSKEELRGTNALKYIEWGEKQKKILKDGSEILWKDVQSVQGRKRWWDLGQNKPSNFLWTMTYRERFFVVANSGFLADARMYDMYCENYIGILCNSTIILFQLELMARGYGGGGGPVDVKVYEINNLLIPNLKNDAKILEKTLSLFRTRDIKTIFEECGINPSSEVPIERQEPNPPQDRAGLDKIVFDALGLNEAERKEVYRAVCRLVWNRISKAKSV